MPLSAPLKNWSENLTYSAQNIYYPTTVAEVQTLVKQCANITALGSKHCFNTIADNVHNLISLQEMNKVLELNVEAQTVTVEGGITYGALCPYLHENGFALHNLASLPHISIAGSCSTATHGSGIGNANLASAVRAIEIVTADGMLLQLSREKDADKFLAVVVGLGAFGIITKITLAIQPTFLVRQNVYVNLPMQQMQANFNEIMRAGYSVSLFTDWQQDCINEVWIKTLVNNKINYNNIPQFFGAVAAQKNMHPIAEVSAENCTEQMGVEGAWHERLPHFKMGFTPSSGKELQSEFFVSEQHAVAAINAISILANEIAPILFISEIRTVAADDFWMSPCRNQASVAIHFTWKQEWEAVNQLLPKIEAALAPFNAKPHWGKVFTMSPTVLAARYEKLAEFTQMAISMDPSGKFCNNFLATNIFATI